MRLDAMQWFPTGGRRLLGVGLLAAVLPLAACDVGEVLEVDDPDIVPPEELSGETGRQAYAAGALLDFAIAYSGAAAGGGSTEGIVMASGLLSDEWVHSGTFPTRTPIDRRRMTDDNGTLRDLFLNVQRARAATAHAAELFAEDDPDGLGDLLTALNGYTYVFFGENYCSGVPFSAVPLDDPDAEFQYGEQLTTAQTFEEALERFEEAQASDDPEIRNLALMGEARALLNLGRFAEAAAVAAEVPTGFAYLVEHSENSDRQENGVHALNAVNERWSMANGEGGSGDPFVDGDDQPLGEGGEGLPFLAARDPRVPWARGGVGFDGFTPQFNLLGYPALEIDLDQNASVPLATGIEARLIEAEAALQGGDPDEALTILNALRADFPLLGLEPLEGPATVDLLFYERAFWLYATGHRLSDLRRLVRQYGRPANEVFPEGDYFKGGVYGEDVNFPIPVEEENNPNFSGCFDRNA